MSTWTTPATATGGSTALTAGFWNTEVRDHLNWSKGFADLITNSTAADVISNGGPYIRVVRQLATSDPALQAKYAAYAYPSWWVTADGYMGWAYQGASASADMALIPDAGNTLRLYGALLRIERTAVGNQWWNGRLSGDANDRLRLDMDASGNPRIRFGNGTTTGLLDVAHDVANARSVVLAADTNGLWLQGPSNVWIAMTDGTASHALHVMPSASGPTVRWGDDQYTAIQRTATGTLAANGRLWAGDGMSMRTAAHAITDGDFSFAAVTGLVGVDTTNERLYVRVGSTWRFADLRGDMVALGPFAWLNLAASQSNLEGAYGDTGSANRAVAPYAGDIVGLGVRGSAAISAGGATAAVFRVAVGGSGGTLTVTLGSSTNPTQQDAQYQAPGIDTFTGGQGIGVLVTTTGTFAPTTTEYGATLYCLMRRP